MNKWWGYLHVNGSIQVKRYFTEADLEDAHSSPFVAKVVEPFYAEDREHAIEIMELRIAVDR